MEGRKTQAEKFVPLVKKPPKKDKMEPGEEAPKRRRGPNKNKKVTKQAIRGFHLEKLEALDRAPRQELQELAKTYGIPHTKRTGDKRLRIEIRKKLNEEYRGAREIRRRPAAVVDFKRMREEGFARPKGKVIYKRADGTKVWVTPKQKALYNAKKTGRKEKVVGEKVEYPTLDGRIIMRSPAQVAFLERQKARKGTGAGRQPRRVAGKPVPVGHGDEGAYEYYTGLTKPRQQIPWKYFYGNYAGMSKKKKVSFTGKKRREFLKKWNEENEENEES